MKLYGFPFTASGRRLVVIIAGSVTVIVASVLVVPSLLVAYTVILNVPASSGMPLIMAVMRPKAADVPFGSSPTISNDIGAVPIAVKFWVL